MPDRRRLARSVAMVTLGLSLALAGTPAAAWNAGGHRLVAAIAWRQMAPGTRAAVGRLLAVHPDRSRWVGGSPSTGSSDYAAFLGASTWPDDIRRDSRFHDDDAPSIPPPVGFADSARHRRWHHTDSPPAGRSPNDESAGQLDRQLPRLLRVLADPAATQAERSYALPWIIHLVADAHQPLHVQSRYDAAGRSDRGGNALWIETPQHPRLHEMTLHAYWDDLAGPPWLRGTALESAADRLTSSTPTGDEGKRVTELIDTVIDESRQLARHFVYSGLAGAVPVIDDDYDARAQRIARERIALAGQRLGKILDESLAADRAAVSRETVR